MEGWCSAFLFFVPNTEILVEWQDTLMDQKGHT